MGEADAERQPSAGGCLYCQRLLREYERMARVCRHDAGTHLDALGPRPGQRDHGQRVGAEDLGDPDAVEAVFFGGYHPLDVFVHALDPRLDGRYTAVVQSDSHALPPIDAVEFRRARDERAAVPLV